jgi:integrase
VEHTARREHVEAFLGDLASRRAPATVSNRHRALRQFFKWATSEGEVEHDPMEKMTSPIVPEHPVPVLREDELRRLLDTVKGTDSAIPASRRSCAGAGRKPVSARSTRINCGTRSRINGSPKVGERATSCGSRVGVPRKCSAATARAPPTNERATRTAVSH